MPSRMVFQFLGVAACFACSSAFGLEVEAEDFGALPDNETLSSDAINKALLHVSSHGGGVVHVRAQTGAYRVGSIELQSNTELRIAKGTTLHASDVEEHWAPVTMSGPDECGGDFIQNKTRGMVFYALRQQNFSITGGGHINGGGAKWNNDFDMRGHFLNFFMVSDVVVEDLYITNSSQWTLKPMFSQRLTFQRLRIEGDPTGPNHHNTDGFDPWACKDVSFLDSYYEAGDDCVAVKSGKNNAVLPFEHDCGVPSENIYVNNITCKHAHGLTIGSEMAGGIRNVTFTNIEVDAGMPVKIKGQCGRGKYVRDIHYENITGGSGVDTAVWLDMRYGHDAPADCDTAGTPIFSNIVVRNVHVKKAKTAFAFVGLEMHDTPLVATIQNITLQNIKVESYEDKGSCTHANLTVLGGVSPSIPVDDSTCTISSPPGRRRRTVLV